MQNTLLKKSIWNITIIGGTNGFGKWLADFLIKHFGKDINLIITGRDIIKGEKFAKKLNISFSNNNIEAVKDADITIFAVPISFMKETIKTISPKLKDNSVVLDICSIKTFTSKSLKQYSNKSILVIPTHPMFGPYINSIAGQIFVLTPDEKVKQDFRYKFLLTFLKNSNAKILETSPKEHDKMMAIVQGLTHYDIFVFGETIKRLGVNIEDSLNFVSPIYKLKISSVARYMNQNPKLYTDIQIFNEEIPNVHKTFIEVSNKFNKYIKNKNEKDFIKSIKKTSKYFGNNAEKGQIYTDKIIYLFSKQIDLIQNNIGKYINFENIYSGKVINEKINDYQKEIIYLENGKKLLLNEWIIFK